MHRLEEKPKFTKPAKRAEPDKPRNMEALAAFYRQCVRESELKAFAESIGVSATSLTRLGIGFDGDAWTFPMVDCDGATIGIRRRFADGKKLSVRGGREGLFIPTDSGDLATLIVVCEGPTDTAAILDADHFAVGRPSCLGATAMVRQLIGKRDVVIVADVDDAGRRGALKLAEDLIMPGRIVKVIEPLTGKDARQWRPSRGALSSVIRSAYPYRKNERTA